MFREKINILGRDIKRGQSLVLDLEVAKLHTRNRIHIPIIIERAKEDGPVMLLMGGIHGDEINGVEIVRRLIRSGTNKPIRGTIVCIPVLNVFGFLSLSREFPDGRDLNRVFPGSATGSLASQFAFQFIKGIAPPLDYILDFHTGGADRVNAPQIRCDIKDEATYNLARVFGAPFIVNSKYLAKTVRTTLRKKGKIPLLFEGGKSKSFDEEILQVGVKGAKNVLRFLEMIPNVDIQQKETIVIKKSKWIRAPYSGMFHLRIENGVWAKKNTLLGIVTDPYGEFEKKVLAPNDGYIFCVNTSPIVNRGDAIFHISLELGDS